VAETNLFKWRHYESDIIHLCVRWRLRYALSYRDLEEMMNERGLSLDHTTIYRWVQAYAPELEKRIRPHLRLTSDSYRVDETYINRTIKGYEVMNMIRKGQIEGVGRKDILGQVGFVAGLFRIAA
jgi:transposase-like protein